MWQVSKNVPQHCAKGFNALSYIISQNPGRCMQLSLCVHRSHTHRSTDCKWKVFGGKLHLNRRHKDIFLSFTKQ